ncbi:fimbrial protein [Vibrio sp. 1S139]|uniref:fimbrial protein n=1 Tax=Vibrio sp. 1S139 TaxID=3230006 RepID=UPI00352E98F0
MNIKSMNPLIIATFVCGLISATPALAENETNVYFKGEIVESACGIAPESIDQTIELGQSPTHIFQAQGDRSTPVPFDIKLVECDTTVASTADFTFLSNPDTSGNLFSVEGGATGVGVRILHNGLPINNGDVAASNVLVDGTNIVSFSAAYEANTDVATTPVTAGNAESWALLRVAYQ